MDKNRYTVKNGKLKFTAEYTAWLNMKTRCYNPKYSLFQRYGGRGIRVCERWLNSFDNFLSDMGKKKTPELSLDRINNDGGYEPSNCRWATHSEQQKNKKPMIDDEFAKMNISSTARFKLRNPERAKQIRENHYRTHRQEKLSWASEHYKQNKEKYREYNRKYYLEHTKPNIK